VAAACFVIAAVSRGSAGSRLLVTSGTARR
jgi:hypothetical protein